MDVEKKSKKREKSPTDRRGWGAVEEIPTLYHLLDL